MSVFKNIALVIVAPRVGWDEVNSSNMTTHRVQQSGYFPLLALLAVASFVRMIYGVEGLSGTLMHALAEFFSFYVSFFLVSYLLGGFYPNLVKTNSGRTRLDNYILYSLSYVAIIEIFINLFDGFDPLYFLLIYAFVIIQKGTVYLGIQGQPKTSKFVALASIMIIFLPLASRLLLEMLILH